MNDNTDKQLRALFEDFRLELTDSDVFMQRLTSHLDALDIMKAQVETRRRASRMALGGAFLAGTVCGVLLSLAMPMLETFIALLLIPLLHQMSGVPATVAVTVATYLIAGAVSLFIAYNTYDLTYAFLRKRHS